MPGTGLSLANDPAVLLADEPTGNLDTETGSQIMDLFVGLNGEGKTIILVTHEPDIATYTRTRRQIVGVGLMLPWPITHFAKMPTVVPAYSIALSLGISLAVGIIFGIYPAIRAARLDPIVALRHE